MTTVAGFGVVRAPTLIRTENRSLYTAGEREVLSRGAVDT